MAYAEGQTHAVLLPVHCFQSPTNEKLQEEGCNCDNTAQDFMTCELGNFMKGRNVQILCWPSRNTVHFNIWLWSTVQLLVFTSHLVNADVKAEQCILVCAIGFKQPHGPRAELESSGDGERDSSVQNDPRAPCYVSSSGWSPSTF